MKHALICTLIKIQQLLSQTFMAVESHGVACPGRCVNTKYDAVTDELCDADLSTTFGVSKQCNKINGVAEPS
jgi:hypothetical protein